MATWIRADGRVDQVLLPKDSPDRMLFIQKCVGGYYAVISLGKDKVMLVNEDAIPMGLPPNPKASAIAASGNFEEMFPDAINEHTLGNKTGMSIIGDVIVADHKELM
jgi:hypothetical protein